MFSLYVILIVAAMAVIILFGVAGKCNDNDEYEGEGFGRGGFGRGGRGGFGRGGRGGFGRGGFGRGRGFGRGFGRYHRGIGGYYGGWNWPWWWYDPTYYVANVPVVSDSDPCNCLDAYKKCIDAGADKGVCSKQLVACLDDARDGRC